ncbi:MAG: hypothetical protein AAB802_02875 [Patescibacteria group bacterium]
MREPIKQHFGIFVLLLVAFGAGMLLEQVQGGNLKTSVLEYGKDKSLEDDAVSFHLQVNEITNDFIDRLINEPEPLVDYPATQENCSEDNVSTYCLAVTLNEELTAFEAGMIVHKDRFREEDETGAISLDEAIKAQKRRASMVDSEVEAARKSVDLTLAVYNELQNTYPVHKELIRLVDNLEEYRDNLAMIRDTVELYPSQFHNVTSGACR